MTPKPHWALRYTLGIICITGAFIVWFVLATIAIGGIR